MRSGCPLTAVSSAYFDQLVCARDEVRKRSAHQKGLPPAPAAPAPSASTPTAPATPGMTRGQARRAGRHERREARRTGRHERREARRNAREMRREARHGKNIYMKSNTPKQQ